MTDVDLQRYFRISLDFHGHKCPAMPLGLRAGLAAMRVLGVSRAKDKELHVLAETGKGHAAGCFLDGIMAATGCTYGKSNIEKKYFNKLAFTLVDVPGKRAVRVAIKPDFLVNMLQSPFLAERKRGVLPQDVAPEIVDPLVEKVLSMPEDVFLSIGPVIPFELSRGSGIFDASPCDKCGEMVFGDTFIRQNGRRLCLGCAEADEGR